MDEDIIRASIFAYAREYLSPASPHIGAHHIADATVTTAPTRVAGWPADAQAYRLLIEAEGWSAEIMVGLRGGSPWRVRVDRTWDDSGTHGGPAGAHAALVEWLRSI